MSSTVSPRLSFDAHGFAIGETIVHPAYGVGRVEQIVTETIAGEQIGLIHIELPEKKLSIKVPIEKTRSVGLRHLSSRSEMAAAFAVVAERPRYHHGIKARRSADYVAKINSGQPQVIAEVVRDLRRPGAQATYTERELFERAVDRLSGELAALEGLDRVVARGRVLDVGSTSARTDKSRETPPAAPSNKVSEPGASHADPITAS
jgi:CarD family transcriptional regulator